jgi:hypothetical protein
MKATVRGQKIEGFYGQDMGKGRWLFVKSARTKRSYSVARVQDGKIVEIDAEEALRDFTNREVAEALLAAEVAK